MTNVEMMGQRVTVDKVLIRDVKLIGEQQLRFTGQARVEWKKQSIAPRAGWVTGFRTLQNGIINPSSVTHTIDGPEEEPSYLTVQSTTKVMMVAFWPSMNPVPVPAGDFTFGGTPKSPSAVSRKASTAVYGTWGSPVLRVVTRKAPRKRAAAKSEPWRVALGGGMYAR